MNTNMQGRFYILHTIETKFKISSPLETLPIIWNRDGEYRIIPCEVVENAIDNLTMWNSFTGKTTHPKVAIMWSQGIEISNLAGRALGGE